MSPSDPVTIRPAGPGDMEALAHALERLSADLDDPHLADTATLAAACTGPHPACHGLLAFDGPDVVGAALFSPVFSSTRGCAGTYVSDVWVSAAARGTGLGRRLLHAAALRGREMWRSGFLKLAVYDDNAAARAFYDRLGFRHMDRDQVMILDTETLLRDPA